MGVKKESMLHRDSFAINSKNLYLSMITNTGSYMLRKIQFSIAHGLLLAI